LIRPQQKKAKEHTNMVSNLRRGDNIITQGGIVGKVAKVKEDGEIEVEIADGVKVRVIKSTVATVISKTEPAK
jgi:preprotein translocase subunit YajC